MPLWHEADLEVKKPKASGALLAVEMLKN